MKKNKVVKLIPSASVTIFLGTFFKDGQHQGYRFDAPEFHLLQHKR